MTNIHEQGFIDGYNALIKKAAEKKKSNARRGAEIGAVGGVISGYSGSKAHNALLGKLDNALDAPVDRHTRKALNRVVDSFNKTIPAKPSPVLRAGKYAIAGLAAGALYDRFKKKK